MFEAPIQSGLHERCGRCGKGNLFRRYLKFNDRCDACGLDFSVADTADGPAFFVGSLVMIVFAPFYYMLPIADISIELKVLLMRVLICVMGGSIVFLLPKFKAILFNLQIQHRAEEANFESTGSHGKPPKKWRY
jgi:uncharacterized protein (DUF983 family)